MYISAKIKQLHVYASILILFKRYMGTPQCIFLSFAEKGTTFKTSCLPSWTKSSTPEGRKFLLENLLLNCYFLKQTPTEERTYSKNSQEAFPKSEPD